ncbi:MAG: DUF4407 domain-containing protein [Bacteroidaceae bacterium]|nr:DUF4407 domain-containing protein [Bacteroidaceae bacterium]
MKNTHETNQTSIFKNGEKVEWGGFLNEFLWICAGVNRRVLRQCPTDYAKYAGVGGTILFTAILASISGGYAIYKVFADEILNKVTNMYETDTHAVIIAAVFGVIWGLMIFNLDRFMVNTMYSDGTHRITSEEWKGARPRLVLAVFIGIVISTPIELRLFKDKIGLEVRSAQKDALSKMDEKQQYIKKMISKLEEQKSENNQRVDEKREERAKIEDQAYKEATGTGGSGKVGIGIYTKQLQQRAENLQREVNRLQDEADRANAAIDTQLDKYYSQLNEHTIDDNVAAKSMKGFCAELDALNTITNPFTDFGLFLARILIMFLFVAIEVIPTLFKLMMIDGPYDAILKAEKHRVRVLSDKRISDINDEINTEVQISTKKNQERLEAELLANKKVMEQIATAQAELLQTAIEAWRKEELAKIKDNPSEYIQTNNKV